MEQEITEQDLRDIAAQLRKPEGESGLVMASMMNDGNAAINLHTIAVLNPQPGDTILEVGMANGYFVKNILGIAEDITYFGCDYSKDMVQLAEELNEKFVQSGRAEFVHGDIRSLPYETNSFDKVFTVNTFYFWDDHRNAVMELKRVLKPEGELILANRPKRIMDTLSVTEYGFTKLSNEAIIELFRKEGFEQVEYTEVKEPDQHAFQTAKKRESVIFKFSIGKIS